MKGSYNIFFLVAMLAACAPKAPRQSGPALPFEERPRLAFEHLSARAKAKVDDGNRNFSATANIRMADDSLTWMSITAMLGIEAGRALFTADSVFILNRLQRKATVESVASLEQRVGLDLNQQQLQHLLLARLPFPLSVADSTHRVGSNWVVSQRRGRLRAQCTLDSTLLVQNAVVADDMTGAQMAARYSDFQPLANAFVPGHIEVTAQLPQEGGDFQRLFVDFVFQDWRLSDENQSYPLEVPPTYSRP